MLAKDTSRMGARSKNKDRGRGWARVEEGRKRDLITRTGGGDERERRKVGRGGVLQGQGEGMSERGGRSQSG